jgi:hypothetical protein
VRIKARTSIFLGLLLTAGAAALFWYRGAAHELSEIPPLTPSAEIAPATLSSTVLVSLDVEQQTFTDALNALPTDCSISGKYTATTNLVGGSVGNVLTGAARTVTDAFSGFRHTHHTNNPTQVSVTFDYEGNIDRTPFAVVVDQGSIDVTSALSASVRAYKGSTSDTVKGALNLEGKAKIDIDPEWQVRPAFDVTYHWTNQPVLNILGIAIGVQNVSSNAIDKMIANTKATLPTSLNASLKLKEKAAAIWQSASQPFAIRVPGLDNSGARELWLSLAPDAIYLPTPTMKGGVLSIGFGLKADVGLKYGEKPAAQVATRLPQLTKSDPSAPGIHVELPLFVGYEGIQSDWLPKLKGQELTFPTQAGEVRIKLRDSKIYPSGKGLAIGLDSLAQVPGRIFDTAGWVYLSGIPQISKTGVLSIENLKFSRLLDNGLVSMVSTIGATLIEGQLSKLLTYDLGPQLSGWQQDANKRLNAPLKELLNPLPPSVPAYLADSTIHVNVSSLKVESLAATAQGLGVTVGLDGTLSAQVKVGGEELRAALLQGLPKNAAGSGVCAINTG